MPFPAGRAWPATPCYALDFQQGLLKNTKCNMGVNRPVWRDRDFVAWDEATVHILAQSLQRGSLAFDYMSVYRAKDGVAIFRLEEHIVRLFQTCSVMRLPIDYGHQELVEGCAETVRRNPDASSLKISALIPSIEADLVPRNPRVAVFICAYDIASHLLGDEKPVGLDAATVS